MVDEIFLNNEKVQAILKEELEALKNRIIANHVNAGQVASGRTRDSLEVLVSPSAGVLLGREYFQGLEVGRAPGRVPRGFFTEIIPKWIQDKGIAYSAIPYVRKPSANWSPKYTPEERGLRSLAGAIAYKIAHEGTRLHRFPAERQDIYSDEVQECIDNVNRRLGDEIIQGISHINLNFVNQNKQLN